MRKIFQCFFIIMIIFYSLPVWAMKIRPLDSEDLKPDKPLREYYNYQRGATRYNYALWPNRYSKSMIALDLSQVFQGFKILDKKYVYGEDGTYCSVKIKKGNIYCDVSMNFFESAKIAQEILMGDLIDAHNTSTMGGIDDNGNFTDGWAFTYPEVKGIGDYAVWSTSWMDYKGKSVSGVYLAYVVRSNCMMLVTFATKAGTAVLPSKAKAILKTIDQRLLNLTTSPKTTQLLSHIIQFSPPKKVYAFRKFVVPFQVRETANIKAILFTSMATKIVPGGLSFQAGAQGKGRFTILIYNKKTLEFALMSKNIQTIRKPFVGGPKIEEIELPKKIMEEKWYPVKVKIKAPQKIVRVIGKGEWLKFKSGGNYWGDIAFKVIKEEAKDHEKDHKKEKVDKEDHKNYKKGHKKKHKEKDHREKKEIREIEVIVWMKATSVGEKRFVIIVEQKDGKRDALFVKFKVHSNSKDQDD